MIRLGCALLIGMLALIAFGCQGIYEGVKHGKQKVVTFQQFVKQRPKEGWYKITGCRLALAYSATRQSKSGTVNRAYVPVYAAIPDIKAKTPLVISSDNKDYFSEIEALNSITGQLDEKSIQRAFPLKDVEGMIQTGLHSSSDRSKIEKLPNMGQVLDGDFLILDEGRKPNLGLSIGMTLGGLGLGAILVLYLINRNRNG